MRNRNAFTIVELVVVALILGILASVAASKILRVDVSARENASRKALNSLRDAIERWYTKNGHFPSPLSLNQLRNDFQRKELPECLVGDGNPQSFSTTSAGEPLAGTGETDSTGKPMWKYDFTTGEVIINFHGLSSTGEYYDNW